MSLFAADTVFVANPEWGWWIVLYFYLGGIAAGVYFLATMIDLFGHEEDHELARLGYFLAFPLIILCGMFLTLDLDRPERFWHMLFQSERVHEALDEGWPLSGGWETILQAPILKYWSPMSLGAWALALFGLCSFLSVLGSLKQKGFLAWLLRRGLFGRLLQIIGIAVGFFIASYTGALLTATNQPIWSDSDWIAPLFLTSAASTGCAVLILLSRRSRVSAAAFERLERADTWALALELAVFAIFLASLGSWLLPLWDTFQGKVLILGTLGLGLLLPLALHLTPEAPRGLRTTGAALLSLAGGFALRYGLLFAAPALLTHPPHMTSEDLHRPLWESQAGKILVALTLTLAALLALAVLKRAFWSGIATGIALGLVSGLVCWYTLTTPEDRAHWQLPGWVEISPEADRPRGGGVGASAFNRPDKLQPPSKITGQR
jgi:formate-dependent nitrite reductase membrane component NrfD